ncbi:MAG: hypothetical protein WCK58_12965 [Chloroflexota bacterium]
MDDEQRAGPAARLVEVEERIDRIGIRLTAGYGSDGDRDGWLLWLRQLTTQRDALRATVGRPVSEPDDPGPVAPAR